MRSPIVSTLAVSRSALSSFRSLSLSSLSLGLLSIGMLASCNGKGDDTAAEAVPDIEEVWSDCDPIVPSACGFPFPSTFHMREDASSATGWRVAMGPTTLPINENDYQPVPDFWNERDGWSVMTPAIVHIPDASIDNMVGHDDIGASLLDASNSIIIDVETGERVPHWVERDVSITDDTESPLLIHGAISLDYSHRYIVALRNVNDRSGAAIPATEAFAALRDKTPTQTWDVEGRRGLYNDLIFPALEEAGWSRGDVTIAWDFVTGSQEGITGKATFMRDDSLANLPDGGPEYTIDEIEETPNEHTAFRVKGHVTVPLYTLEDKAGTVLTRGDDGMPFINGETSVPFTVIVPNSLVANAESGPIVQYGHGLLGDQGEVGTGYIAEMADTYGWIVFAVDWTGMKEGDVSAITLMLVNQLDQFAIIPERSHQGFVEFLYGMELVAGPLASDPAMMVEDPDSGDMVSLVDPSRRYYYGNSQGAIMGGAYATLAPYFDRAVLGVGGGPYHLLLTRSQDFEPFFMVFKTMYPDPKHIALWLGLIQTLWDSAESSGYANASINGDLPGTTPTRILQQVAVGDSQVTTLGAEVLARTYGASLIGEPVRPVWGLEVATEPVQGPVLVEWDYGLEEPYTNQPPTRDEDPHELPRREPAAQAQLEHFLRTGDVLDFCEGPCQDLSRWGR
jgi:hypothetical protein